jgi:D-glycero-D-manno-heptose 1,7-bisphosphate phosphatase
MIANVLPSLEGSRPQNRVNTVFLDRDGVINEKMPEGHYVRSEGDVHLLPGVPEAIAKLNCLNIRVIVMSNQRGVALGLMSAEAVERIHAYLQRELAKFGAHVDAFYYCPHDKNSCLCRKPSPGMFEQALRDFPEISAERSVMVGDSLSDIEFGRNLGIQTVWIRGNAVNRKSGWEIASQTADHRCSSLAEAVDLLLKAGSLEKSDFPY